MRPAGRIGIPPELADPPAHRAQVRMLLKDAAHADHHPAVIGTTPGGGITPCGYRQNAGWGSQPAVAGRTPGGDHTLRLPAERRVGITPCATRWERRRHQPLPLVDLEPGLAALGTVPHLGGPAVRFYRCLFGKGRPAGRVPLPVSALALASVCISLGPEHRLANPVNHELTGRAVSVHFCKPGTSFVMQKWTEGRRQQRFGGSNGDSCSPPSTFASFGRGDACKSGRSPRC